jgi:hypothetical protein
MTVLVKRLPTLGILTNVGEPDETSGPLWAAHFVVPDDISELDADVQAYHRELRTWRRLQRQLRWRRRMQRFGLGPLLVMLLVVALAVGALLVSFVPSASLRDLSSAPIASSAPSLLPHVILRTTDGPLDDRLIRPMVYALVPDHCSCFGALANVAAQVTATGLSLTAVARGPGPSRPTDWLGSLVSGLPGSPILWGYDAQGSLTTRYAPRGVTLVLVAPDGTVPWVLRSVSARTPVAALLHPALYGR